MGYPPTPVLQIVSPDTAGSPIDFADRVVADQQINRAMCVIDTFAAAVTGSACFSIFALTTGSVSDQLGDQGIVGLEFNRSCDRIIQEVVAWAANSGSGGVTTIDIAIQQGPTPPANFSTVFKSVNNADRLALSASLGNYGVARQANFVSGSNMVWPRGTLLRAQLITAAGAPGASGQKGVTVQVFWKPSGSYGA